jgi:hypothetical protein
VAVLTLGLTPRLAGFSPLPWRGKANRKQFLKTDNTAKTEISEAFYSIQIGKFQP